MTPVRSPGIRSWLLYTPARPARGCTSGRLTIARHLLARYPNAVVYLVTKSALAGHVTLPERCDYIKLPSLLTPGGWQRTALEEEDAKRHLRELRGTILRDAALGLAPDLVLVDHEPLGAKGEFAAGLRALKAARPDTRFVFGLRDIMDDPERIRGQWRELGVYDALDHLYDGIAVYGSPALHDVAEAYGIPPGIRPKLHYCGYIVREPPPRVDPAVVRRELGLPVGAALVLATVGSGSDGFPVLDAAVAAVERLAAKRPELRAIVVTGPFMPALELGPLVRRHEGPRAPRDRRHGALHAGGPAGRARAPGHRVVPRRPRGRHAPPVRGRRRGGEHGRLQQRLRGAGRRPADGHRAAGH